MNINLEVFEGPLDFLLHLIKKSDVDIHDIPINSVLVQYLAYLDLLQELDIDTAGEFILMAAELAHIKSRLLIFQEGECETEDPDPRADLVAKLLEYQKYKNAAGWLIGKNLLARDVFKRPESEEKRELDFADLTIDVEPYHLVQIFQKVLKKAPKGAVHEVEAERISISERIYQVLDQLEKMESLAFEDLFAAEKGRAYLVVSFLAVLEMARLKIIRLYQTENFSPIRVKLIMEQNKAKAMEDDTWKEMN